MQYIELKSKRVSVEKVDVVVAGGGPGGIGAGVAAARNGANTIICEEYGFLGGMMTVGYVLLLPLWLLTPYGNEDRSLVEGIAKDFVERLEKMGGTIDPNLVLKYYNQGTPIFPDTPPWTQQDMEITKILSQRMILEANGQLKLHNKVVDVIMEDNNVKGVVIGTKQGLKAILANTIIDATGDADIAAMVGAPYDQHFGEGVLPMTLEFYTGGVNNEKFKEYLKKDPGLTNALHKANLTFGDRLTLPQIPNALSFCHVNLPKELKGKYNQVERKGEVLVWGLHIHGKDVTKDLSYAEQWCRDNVDVLANFLKEHIPGFENSYISSSSPGMGTRESRRITGHYRLCAEDINEGKRFKDGIVRSLKGAFRLEDVKKQKSFDIPYRCLLPIGTEGIIVAGRAISIDHASATFLSPRDIITCIGVGEAAGTAAAIASKENLLPSQIDVGQLRKQLQKQGANLG